MSTSNGHLPSGADKDSSLISLQVTRKRSSDRTDSDDGKAAFSSPSPTSEISSDGDSSHLGSRIDRLSPVIDKLKVSAPVVIIQIVRM